jgi:hypothetical protein
MYGVEIYATVRQLVPLQGARQEPARGCAATGDQPGQLFEDVPVCGASGYVRTKPVDRLRSFLIVTSFLAHPASEYGHAMR